MGGGGGGGGGESPLKIHETFSARTPSDARSDWASESAAAIEAEDYNIFPPMSMFW